VTRAFSLILALLLSPARAGMCEEIGARLYYLSR